MKNILRMSLWVNGSLVFLGVVLLISYHHFLNKPLVREQKMIAIESGDTFGSIGNKIGGINKLWFKFYLKQNQPSFDLQVGNYRIEEGSSIQDIFVSLQYPLITQVKVTLLEGWNIYDIDDYLLKSGLTQNEGDYIEYVTDRKKIIQLSEFFPFIKGVHSLEGFLYPDTYMVKTHFKINEFVIQQLENFENKVYKNILKNKGYSNKTIYDILILASIVEKEEKNPKNKPVVAGILKKRLREGWMLGADITVCYPYKLTSEQCKMLVTKYINKKNDYNTRTMTGLPKTPIGNPTFDTIYATINDKKTDYYYYLHDISTGKIYYGKTHNEHIKNKNLYIR